MPHLRINAMKSEIKSTENAKRGNLERLLNPKSIAVVGATPRAGSFGARTIENLEGFRGNLYLVNGKYESIGRHRCYGSLSELPEKVDSVIVALPSDLVEEAVVQCARIGVGGAIVYASGFAEMSGGDDPERQDRIVAIANESDVRLLGPNCIGVVNYGCGAVQTFQQFPITARNNGRAIGLISQSGALALALSQATERGVSFSHILTFGNGADVELSDLIEYMVDSPECHAIACVFEGLARPEKLVAAAAMARQRGKPLIVCKLATGQQGAKAALSHSGTLAGSSVLYRALLEDEGVIVTDRFEAVVELASFFAKAPRMAGAAKGVGVVAASGGAGIMAADKAESYGLELPQPAADTQALLKENIPAYGSASNPCDVTATVVNNPESLVKCMDAMGADPAYGAFVVPHTVAGADFVSRGPIYSETARKFQKPVCAVWLSAWANGPGSVEFESDPYVSVFTSMDNCFFALERWNWQSTLPESDAKHRAFEAKSDVEKRLRNFGSATVLTEQVCKELLGLYGVATNREAFVTTSEQARIEANRIGFPIALKAVSPDLPHKTEAGAVVLNIANECDLAEAFDRITAKLSKIPNPPRLDGFLVEEMVQGDIEVIVGGRVDPDFGPVVMVGHGGIFAELFGEPAISSAPVSVEKAASMLSSLKGQMLFDGFRGRAKVNREALAKVVSHISQFLSDHAASISELDVNPVLCRGDAIVAVDALIVRA